MPNGNGGPPASGGFLKDKKGGIPMWAWLIGGGILAYYLWTRYSGGSASDTSPSDTQQRPANRIIYRQPHQKRKKKA